MSSWSATHLEPTGCTRATWPSTTFLRMKLCRGVTSTARSECAAYGSSSASALRMIWLPPCSAIVSTTTFPSRSSLTVPLTVISCSREAHAAELDREALESARVAAHGRGVGPRHLGHRVEAVQDHAGQADALGELLVDVDRVGIAGGVLVALRQPRIGRDLELGDRVAAASSHDVGPRRPHGLLAVLVLRDRLEHVEGLAVLLVDFLDVASVVIVSPAQTGSPQTNSWPPWTIRGQAPRRSSRRSAGPSPAPSRRPRTSAAPRGRGSPPPSPPRRRGRPGCPRARPRRTGGCDRRHLERRRFVCLPGGRHAAANLAGWQLAVGSWQRLLSRALPTAAGEAGALPTANPRSGDVAKCLSL